MANQNAYRVTALDPDSWYATVEFAETGGGTYALSRNPGGFVSDVVKSDDGAGYINIELAQKVVGVDNVLTSFTVDGYTATYEDFTDGYNVQIVCSKDGYVGDPVNDKVRCTIFARNQ